MILRHFTFEPFLIDHCTLRKGLLLYLKGSNGRETTAEVSPLPGFSFETLGQAKLQLTQIQRRMTTTWWSKSSLQTLSQMNLYPSVHFALEMSLLNLIDPIDTQDTIKSYSLLFGTPDEILSTASELQEKGQTEIKVKLGHLAPTDAFGVLDELKKNFRIRLDFNRKWKREDSISLCEMFQKNQLIYVEEPCQNPNELINFPYPFALDESLRDQSYPPLLLNKNLKALILKPTLLYPLSEFLELNIPCVVTSSFESPIGIGQLECFIQRLGLEHTLHGLDTLRYIQNDSMPHCLSSTASR